MAAPGLSVRGLAFDPNQPRDEQGRWTDMSGPVPEGHIRLYRVESKDLGDRGAWLKNHLTSQQWDAFVSERGRLFADNLHDIENYGAGEDTHNTYVLDLPAGEAAAARREHSQTPGFFEYLVPAADVARKRPARLAPRPPIRAAGAKDSDCNRPGRAIIGPHPAENSPTSPAIRLIGAADPLPSRYRMSKFAAEHAAELVQAPRRVRMAIRAEVRKALRNGEGPAGIADRLIGEVDMEPARLDTIARTEWAMARTAARVSEALVDYGDVDLEKTWRVSPANCCDRCMALNGQTVPLDEPFFDDDGNAFNGPPVHPNCACDIEIREVAEMQRRAAIGFVGAGFDPNQPRDENGRWVDGSGAVIIDKRVSADEGKAFLEAVDALPERVKRGIRNKIVQLVPSVEEFGHAHSAGEIFGATGDTGILVKAHPGAKTVLYHEIGHQETKFLAKRPAFQAAFEKDTAKAHRGQLAYYASKPEEAFAQSFAYHMGGDDENRKAFERGFKNSHATLGAHLAKMAAMRKATS